MTLVLFGLLFLLGFGGVSATGQFVLTSSDPTLPDYPIVYASSDPPLPALPSNCYYLNLWSYYMRWNGLAPVEDQPPYGPNSAGDPPLIQHETQLFTPPENISFATPTEA